MRGGYYHNDILDLFETLYGGRGSRRGFGGGYGGGIWGDGMGGDVDRSGFAPVSQRAMNALDSAKKIFLDHLATVDTSRGPVDHEIIRFHLVGDMRKSFNKYVKEYGCTGTSRQLTRAEQDLINKSRKSLLYFTSVKVTPEAQRAYLEKNPHLPKPKPSTVASISSSASASASSSSAASASISASASSSISSGRSETIFESMERQKRNHAAVLQRRKNASIKKFDSLNKKKA
ncbi:hypothetical protein M413DRAFT_373703 [Hebeloma cylindrosporum]|uniref:Uncharacterized protein n=1 Tax=Hebeloma cylindrosporum TaxID=76867 RepID=A0A0C3CIP6_HEBCY|nr:hypothetical protein M413DRAFT_373703 [Hebeloma cylindrosporum h7]